MQVIEAKLYGGEHDGRVVEVPSTAFLLSVSEGGDTEVIACNEAADAVVCGHELYRADEARLLAYKYTTLNALMKAVAA